METYQEREEVKLPGFVSSLSINHSHLLHLELIVRKTVLFLALVLALALALTKQV